VKNASPCAKRLTALLNKLPAADLPEMPDADDPVAILVQSFLMWEWNTDAALAAYGRVNDAIIDFNDLRVSMPHEIESWLGPDDPLAIERAQRLRASLRNIFLREHAISLDALKSAGKREVRRYIESLEGAPPYVAARVMLLAFNVHAVPLDEQLRGRLIEAGAADESADVPELANWLARQIKATNGRATHAALQAWIDRVGPVEATEGGRSTKRSDSKRRSSRSSASTSTSAARG
jgi:hypothetical protein